MDRYSRTHLTDPAVSNRLDGSTTNQCVGLADHLADIAEFDARRLYVPASFSSMLEYCTAKLRMSRYGALKRIGVARAARKFPAIFVALAEARHHLSGMVMLVPHLTPENVDELLAAGTHKTESEIELLLAERFPRPDLPMRIAAIAPPTVPEQIPQMALASRRVESAPNESALVSVSTSESELAPTTPPPTPTPVAAARTPPARIAALTPERFGLQVTISKSTHDKLRHAQNLLRHQMPSGDVAQVLDRALDALIHQLEKRKFAATSRPRPRSRHKSANARHIPADVKREVWERDGGQCTYVSDSGRRCDERGFLEFDHMDPVARGGEASVERIRLRCRAHNQLEAERAFGTEFMRHKRENAAQRAAERAAHQTASSP